jgi:Rap1a immunity proteins
MTATPPVGPNLFGHSAHPHKRHALLLLVLCATTARADITAMELAETCSRALAQNYVGLDAEACNWYVAPCPVCGPGARPEAEWCAPEGEPATAIASRAVAALRARPDAAHEPARVAVKAVLSRAYPCP